MVRDSVPSRRSSRRASKQYRRRSRICGHCRHSSCNGFCSKPARKLTYEEAKAQLAQREREIEERRRLREEQDEAQRRAEEAKRSRYEELVAYEAAHEELPFTFLLFEIPNSYQRPIGAFWFRGVYSTRRGAEAAGARCREKFLVIRRLMDRDKLYFHPDEENANEDYDNWSQ